MVGIMALKKGIHCDIEKFTTADKGLGLRACTNFTEGVVLFSKKPYAHIIAKNQRNFFCDQCLKR